MKKLELIELENIEGGISTDCGVAIAALALTTFSSFCLLVCPPAGVLGMVSLDAALLCMGLSGYSIKACE